MVPDLKTYAHKECKIVAQKKSLFFGEFCLTSKICLVSVLISASVEGFFVSYMEDFFFICLLSVRIQLYYKYFFGFVTFTD